MMTPEQRYLFDVFGYLHIENALSKQELEACQRASARYMNTPEDKLPPGFGFDGKRHLHGFAFDKSLEALTRHPSIWPIVRELTNYKPRLISGTLQVDRPGESAVGGLHCAREGFGWESTRYETHHGRVYCDDIIVFPYLDDVFPGDGGLIVLPGSHKANFPRPESLFNNGLMHGVEDLAPGVVNITPRAGDIIVTSELMTHGILEWRPGDRIRRILVLRYKPQHAGLAMPFPDEVKAVLSPETLELIETAHYNHVKDIVKDDTDVGPESGQEDDQAGDPDDERQGAA
ncbi:MAG: phytanoyl-CoA dioxygenase family protein [Gemmatimonadota bacterium]|nr:phytanoyl-CoA dioxygenase family protein [Gemmatimonadota bacterium]